MDIFEFPIDLKNVISAFAYDCKWETVVKDLNTCQELEKMVISPVFLRKMMWSTKYIDFIPNPLICFEPIQNYSGSFADLVDWHAVQELLWRLDFRRRFVKLVNTREQWRTLFKKDWRNIESFDAFFRFLVYTRVECFKPLWKTTGFAALASYRSPFVSARWWLDSGFI